MPSVKQIQVTFDCAEPGRVARFWCEVLGYVVPPPPEGFANWNDFDRALPPEHQGSTFACIDPSRVGPRLFFQRVPEGKIDEARTGRRIHLDVMPTDGSRDDEVERLKKIGATEYEDHRKPDGTGWVTMADPEGNLFCVERCATERI
jgi:hypothetical protein